MLIFVDQPKQIRIIRTAVEDGSASRAAVGRLMKNNLTISEDLKSALTPTEAKEVQEVIETYQQAETARKQVSALQLPVTIREAMDYFEDSASECERRLIMSALMEALRRMRKFEREQRQD